jgi:cysteinyl-tRNA synthetase
MDDDINTPILISRLFDGVKTINYVKDGRINIDQENLDLLKKIYTVYVNNILGLTEKEENTSNDTILTDLIDSVLILRQSAKERKEWKTADDIRDALQNLGVTIKDRKDGADWKIN